MSDQDCSLPSFETPCSARLLRMGFTDAIDIRVKRVGKHL
jgi:Fe2+ transport system protein FeoA